MGHGFAIDLGADFGRHTIPLAMFFCTTCCTNRMAMIGR
jgi:hypothetical protein